jgi:hypothetical protein
VNKNKYLLLFPFHILTVNVKADFWTWNIKNVLTMWSFLTISKLLRKTYEENVLNMKKCFFMSTVFVPDISVQWIFMHREAKIYASLYVVIIKHVRFK